MIQPDTIFLASWAIFLTIWAIGSFVVKRDIAPRSGLAVIWLRYLLLRFGVAGLVIVFAVRLSRSGMHRGDAGLHGHLFVPPLAVDWIGAALTVGGIAFAVWARVHLGRNWSSAPARKEGHDLVTSGPYRQVRHPIYTGIILATFGGAMTGSVLGLALFVIVSITFFRRVGAEEQIMRDLFPAEYAAYSSRTKRLIPFVW
jgi:protein-S-isoprenylcysteine O-methyltransferase Ste14